MNITSTLPPQAAQAAAVSSLTVSSPSTSKLVGFINDKFSSKCQQVQRRRFLRSGIRPSSGMRIELNIILSNDGPRGNMPFRLSGEVVSACEPVMSHKRYETPEKEKKEDTTAAALSCADTSSMMLCLPCSTSTFRPSTSADDCGVGKGSVVLASMIQSLVLTNQQSPSTSSPLTGRQIHDAWAIAEYETKKKITDSIASKLGALHGQRIVCEGRLNFDYDMRRGTEDGPWIDGIPFDGRDVWGFTLVCDDSLENMWRVDPLTFVNLGRTHRPRCWPWSESNVLPFERLGEGNDAPLLGPGPNGAISVHTCKGPFGCSGKDHPHSYQAQAA